MPSPLSYLRGPDLYATLKPKRHYEANWLERLGGSMIYFSSLVRALAWPTSPLWLYYSTTRKTWDRQTIVHYACWIICYHALAFGARTLGRYMNRTYWEYLQVYCKATKSPRSEVPQTDLKRLQEFDFQITKNTPVAFTAAPNANVWYLGEQKAENVIGAQAQWKIQLKRLIASACIYTFGRRMLYPGSIDFLKTLLFPHVLAGRLKLILEQNAERLQVRAVDGNIIDLIFVDRREIFPDQPLIICCDGNGGFYETGISRTPVDLNYSVLAWNPPGFSESSGTPYPRNILNAMDAVLQLAFERGFSPQKIVLFGWSIGGFPATWATANYPQIRGLILDASFDDIMPLALGTMPAFTEEVVKIAIREHFNLDVAEQLSHYNGPVRIIRRYNDEVVTTYHGPDLELRRKENRGNHLLLKFLKGRYPNILITNDDENAVFNIWKTVRDVDH